jgi:hypothetical protein
MHDEHEAVHCSRVISRLAVSRELSGRRCGAAIGICPRLLTVARAGWCRVAACLRVYVHTYSGPIHVDKHPGYNQHKPSPSTMRTISNPCSVIHPALHFTPPKPNANFSTQPTHFEPPKLNSPSHIPISSLLVAFYKFAIDPDDHAFVPWYRIELLSTNALTSPARQSSGEVHGRFNTNAPQRPKNLYQHLPASTRNNDRRKRKATSSSLTDQQKSRLILC